MTKEEYAEVQANKIEIILFNHIEYLTTISMRRHDREYVNNIFESQLFPLYLQTCSDANIIADPKIKKYFGKRTSINTQQWNEKDYLIEYKSR